MQKPPIYLKTLALIGLIISVIGLIIAFKIPGNIAFAPLTVSLLIAIIIIIIARKNRYKCFGGYIISIITTIGIIITLVQQSKTPVVAIDELQIEQIEETNDEVMDELNDALDELDSEELE